MPSPSLWNESVLVGPLKYSKATVLEVPEKRANDGATPVLGLSPSVHLRLAKKESSIVPSTFPLPSSFSLHSSIFPQSE